jgi:CxxC motif-containing protein (DUF1111 family)
MRLRALAITTIALCAACGDSSSSGENKADASLALLGGDTTIFSVGPESFAYPARNLSPDHRSLFQLGDGMFNRNWVTAPATPQGNDGLGPTFNGRSCSACHADNGRGAPPIEQDEPFLGLLLRVSVPGQNEHGGPKPDPIYGDQINPFGLLNVAGEATPTVSYSEQPGKYGDGKRYSLRTPSYAIASPAYGPLAADLMVSPRLAPQTIGLGLLEAVTESTLEGFAKRNGGHLNHVWDEAKQATVAGRFGWKANQPSIKQQVYGAARNDIGITNALFTTENCPTAQDQCADAPRSLTQPELEPLKGDSLVAHGMSHAVPARRDLDDPLTQRGEELFDQIGCGDCHIAELKTGTLEGWPELSKQTIHPFTDLLLHDMGPDLADGRPDFEATGSEWRTPPLWGLGLVSSINDQLFLLHDGRARGFEEAILWHGGQGKRAGEAFRTSPEKDREALVDFLSSL